MVFAAINRFLWGDKLIFLHNPESRTDHRSHRFCGNLQGIHSGVVKFGIVFFDSPVCLIGTVLLNREPGLLGFRHLSGTSDNGSDTLLLTEWSIHAENF